MIGIPGKLILGWASSTGIITLNTYTIDQIIALLQSLQSLANSQEIGIKITVPQIVINGVIKNG